MKKQSSKTKFLVKCLCWVEQTSEAVKYYDVLAKKKTKFTVKYLCCVEQILETVKYDGVLSQLQTIMSSETKFNVKYLCCVIKHQNLSNMIVFQSKNSIFSQNLILLLNILVILNKHQKLSI